MTKLLLYRDVVDSNNCKDNPLFNKQKIKFFKCRILLMQISLDKIWPESWYVDSLKTWALVVFF